LNNKQCALQLSKEAIHKLSTIVFKEPMDFSKQTFHSKAFYFHIDGECYVLKLGKEYCQLIRNYYEHVKNDNNELTVVKPITGTSTKQPVDVKSAVLLQDIPVQESKEDQKIEKDQVIEKQIVPFYQKSWFVGSLAFAIIASIIMFLKK